MQAKFLLILFIPILISACAPGLSTKLSLPPIEDAEKQISQLDFTSMSSGVHVLPFDDQRTVEAIVQIDGRLIKPDNELGILVQDAIERSLKKRGAKLALFNAASIRGAIKTWQAFVVPNFPSTTVNVNASLLIEIFDSTGKPIHKASYSGDYSEQHPFMNESKIADALNKTMNYAIAEFLNDPQVINKLTTIPAQQEEHALIEN
jgi:uncharacterized lipoprotein YajG